MPKAKLTKRTVETLAVLAKDYISFDAGLAGFGIRVMPSGKRFFLVQYRRHGRIPWTAVSLALASLLLSYRPSVGWLGRRRPRAVGHP